MNYHRTIPSAIVLLALGLVSFSAARAQAFVEQEITFSNEDVTLAGTLILPATDGPHPAVVFLHGSGPASRAGARPYAEVFARLGIASLFFDKRGAGDSDGSWLTSSLDDLARDGLAAIEHLKTNPRIDGDRIGFWGVSQAGWVATRAATMSDGIAFMVLISGGGASPRESEMFSYEHEFERAGLSEGEREKAREILTMYFEFLASGERRKELEESLQGLRSTRLEPLADQLGGIMPSDANRTNWSWVAEYDPGEDIRNLNFPVLLMFGSEDTAHPTEASVASWTNGLALAGNDRATIIVFPGAGHGIRLRSEDGGRGAFADGYEEIQIGWLWKNVVDRSH